MRLVGGLLLLAFSMMLASCGSNTPLPTAPGASIPTGPAVPLSVEGYGETIDSLYYKVWSDSSWEAFNGDTVINGTAYMIMVDNNGFENFYSSKGYAGFEQYGGTAVIFDSALASVPDTMVVGTTYALQTTFNYQGASHVLLDLETLLDSTTVSVPFGTFTNCRVMHSVGAIDNVLQYSTYYWLAKGPSDIAREYDNGYASYAIQMAYGVVNGQGWGVVIGDTANSTRRLTSGPSHKKGEATAATLQSASSIQSLAPAILRGVGRVVVREGWMP